MSRPVLPFPRSRPAPRRDALRMLLLLLLLLSLLPAASCAVGGRAARYAEANRRIAVHGVALGSPEDFREIGGVVAREEPCLRGYERVFDDLELSVGYGKEGRVRRISTRGRGTSVYGVSPGDPLPAARERLLAAGFREGGGPNRFADGPLAVALLVDGGGTVFGIVVEAVE